MKTTITIEIENEYEAARLVNLIEDGFKILEHQGRNQRGIDGYSKHELNQWRSAIQKTTNVVCEFANSKIF